MALIRCPDCSREVSDLAAACPQCGRPVGSYAGTSPSMDATLAIPSRQLTPSAPRAEPGLPQLTPRAASPEQAGKPIAGIATVFVLGTANLVWALLPARTTGSTTAADLATISRGLQTLGNMGVIVGALMALLGNRAGNRVVRTTSWLMIPLQLLLVCAMAVLLNDIPATADPRVRGAVVALVALGLVLATAPWLLYLYLFRKSRYG